MLNVKFWILLFGTFLSILMYAFYQNSRQIELNLAKKEQLIRAEETRQKLNEFVTVSEIISRFIQEDINAQNFSKKQIEQHIQQYLKSSPNELIFGIGIWYENYKFNKEKKYFGPYVHRANQINAPDILTYEWNTAKYDYPSQEWYRQGLTNNGESFFVDPYIDADLVYVTNSRSFFDQNRNVSGVISVDLVLPQLQNFVEISNNSDQENIYIIDRSSRLLAHPLKNIFFESLQKNSNTTHLSLLEYKIQDIEQNLDLDRKNWIESRVSQNKLGWTIIISSSEDYLLKRIKNLKNTLLITFIFIWLIIIVLLKNLKNQNRQKELHDQNIENGRIQLIQSSKMAALGVMASGIAHEINNPLAIIVGKAQAIEKQLNDRQIQEPDIILNSKKILMTANRISQIIKGLKTFSRSGDNDPLKSESIENLINDTVSICSEKFKNNSIDLQIQSPPSININCRATQISQVFYNLLSNSYDAVENLDEKWIKINFNILSFENQIEIVFTDSGLGISTDILNKIMQPFFTTKEVGRGTGLGLSISKGIIEDHKGFLYVDTKSKNTKFVIRLPIV